jgi:hypothetical protein
VSSKSKPNIIVRYTNPTAFDYYEYGKILKVEDQYYIQTSKDLEKPVWKSFGTILDHVFKPYVEIEDFFKSLLNIYSGSDIEIKHNRKIIYNIIKPKD